MRGSPPVFLFPPKPRPVKAGFSLPFVFLAVFGVKWKYMIEYRKQAHAVYYTCYHLVFVTKYRRKVLKQGMGSYAQSVFKNIVLKYPDIEILEMNTDEDHIHLMVVILPKLPVSHAVNILKSNSARAMRLRFPFLASMYEHDNLGFWSDGYFVSTVGLNEKILRRYIEAQGQEDKGQTKFVW